MAQTIKLKRSATAGNIPTSSDLALGEIAINTADGAVYIKKGNDDIVAVADNDILHIDTTNSRVGINETSPDSRLHITGSDGGWDKHITIEHDSSDIGKIIVDTDGMKFRNMSSGNGFYFRDSANATQMLIDSSGNVAIGTTSIDEKLHVQGSVNNDDIAIKIENTYDDNLSTSRPAAALLFQAASTNAHLRVFGAPADTAANHQIDLGSSASGSFITFSPQSTERMRIASNGNVGIGTDTPLDLIHIKSTTTDARQVIDGHTGFDAELKFAEAGTVKFTTGFDAATDKFVIGTTNVDTQKRFTIDNNGAITFNEAFTFPTADGSANQVLQTDGSGNLSFASVSGGGSSNSITDADGDTKIQVEETSDEDQIRFDAAGTERFRIGSDVQVLAATDFNITGTSRRLNFTAGSGTVRTTTANSLILATNNTTALTIDSSQNATFAGTINSGAITSSGDIKAAGDLWVNYNSSGNEYLNLNYASGGDGGILFRHSNALKWQHGATTNTGNNLFWYSYDASQTVMSLTTSGLLTTDSGYQVNGQTVIDSSRNLTNIGTISSGAITSTGNITLAEYLYHNGNTGTNLRFQTDRATLTSGGGAIVDAHSNGNLYLTGTTVQVYGNYSSTGTISSGEITTTAPQFKYVSNTDSNVGLLIRDATYISNEADITATRLATGSNLTLGLAGQEGINAYIGGVNKFSINSSGNATFAGSITANGIDAGGNIEADAMFINTPDAGGSPATTAILKIHGYEGRGAGIKIRDSANSASGASNREWFIGSGYSQSGFNIGYAADGSQSSYSAQNKLSIDTSGNATFAGTISSDAITVNTTSATQLVLQRSGTTRIKSDQSGSNGGFVYTGSGGNTWTAGAVNNDFVIADNAYMGDGTGTTVLTLDTSANATFAGTISSGAITSTGVIKSSGSDSTTSGQLLNLHGSSVNQTNSGTIRLTEGSYDTSPFFQGGFIRYDGASNVLKIGTHDAADSNLANDIDAITIVRNTGNATFSGTISSGAITSTGAIQGTSFSDGTISGITFIDEDSFATNSATRVPTQQSIKAYVDAQVAGVVDTAPAALNTLNELAAALGDDASFSTTTSTALGNRLRVDTASQGLTGTQQANAITNLGITATKAELNYVDGVTSNIQTQLDGKQPSGSYLTGNQTITLSGDVSGSGTTSIAVTIADDSHNHVISNVDGLQTALDAKLPLAGGTMTGTLTLPDTGFSIGNEYHKWKRAYSVSATSPQEILYRDGNSLPDGGAYRFTAHIDGTGTDQSATAVFWNQNGTWRVNVTGQSGTSSNHPEFIISSSTNKPTIHIDHSSAYSVQILHERIELSEGTGTDNAGFAFGTDAFLGSVNNNLYFLPGGTAATGVNSYDDGQIVFHDGYHPNADTWTTARTLSLTGAVTGSVSWDGSGNASIATTATADPTLTLSGDASGSATFTNLGNATLSVTVADDSHNHVISNVDGLQSALDAKASLSGATFTGAITASTINTGQGATEVYLMNQNVRTSDSPTFADLTVTGNLSITGDINSYNVTDLDVTDKTITVGAGQTEANSGGSGLIVDGSGASLLWDESDNYWAMNKSLAFDDTVTTTNQALGIKWTGFDKEGTTDFTDSASIVHTVNTGGHSGSVLLIQSQNDANDGIAFTTNASSYLKHNSSNILTAANAFGQLGITSTAAELNVLDGYTGSVTELNYLDTLHATGVTSTEFDYLDGVTSNIQTQLDGKQPSGSYLTGNQTITLSGDVSGSGTTSIAVTIADDSHNHVISNVDGLQTALDGKLPLAGGTMTGNINMGANNITMSNSNISGVNALTINDPGEGIIFTGTNNVSLYAVDDAADNIMKFDGAAKLLVNNDRVLVSSERDLATNSTGTSSTDFVTVYTVNGNNLASHVKLSITGTTGNVVVSCVADILCNHSGDIFISSMSGNYTQMDIKVTSDGNEDFAIECKRTDTQTTQATLRYSLVAMSQDTTITQSSSHSYSTTTLTHRTKPGSYQSATDGADHGYFNNMRVGDYIYHDGDTDTSIKFDTNRVRIFDGGGTYLDTNNGSAVLHTSTTFGGDVSGTYDNIVVADDSHNHVISNVDGLQTALDGKLSTSGTAANSQLLDSLDSTAFLRSNANDDFSGTLNYTPDTGVILSVDGQAILERMTANGAITIGHDDAVIIAGGDTSAVLNTNIDNATETVFIGAEGGLIVYAFPDNDTNWSNRKSFSFTGNGLDMNSVFTVDINGNLSATTKSFDIEHPSKEGMRLRYGSLEGPENGVYVRGKSKEKVILLPDYWPDLIHEDSITVQLTAIGGGQNLYVEDIKDNKVYVNGDNYFYYIQAERKDVERFEVEYEI